MSGIKSQLLEEVGRQMRGHKRLAEGALAQLKDEDFFVTLDAESNSIAILMKHIAGKPSREELMRWWEQGWGVVLDALERLKPEDLTRTVYIRQEPHTVVQALNRALAHYVFHIGQIVFLAKHLRSSEWKTLSVPRGKSEEFNRMSLEERRRIGHPLAKDAGAKS